MLTHPFCLIIIFSACPIIGSKSFEEHKHTYSHQVSELLSSKGGYECLDVTTSLENCGGCTATGEGQDCTKIPHVDGVGCGGGQCQIFSCTKGYAPGEPFLNPLHLKMHKKGHDRLTTIAFIIMLIFRDSPQWNGMRPKIQNPYRKSRSWKRS